MEYETVARGECNDVQHIFITLTIVSDPTLTENDQYFELETISAETAHTLPHLIWLQTIVCLIN